LPEFNLLSADLFVYYPVRLNQTARARAFIDFPVERFRRENLPDQTEGEDPGLLSEFIYL